ncbi:MAG: alginate export family protein [Planctomycetes bacterium]|nr:alginate export family protein [Planctomycetota bacterium]
MRGLWPAAGLAAFLIAWAPLPATAQSNEDLLKRLDTLEKRVKELEAEKAARAATPPTPAPATPAPATPAAKPGDSAAPAAAAAPALATPPKPAEKSWWERIKLGGQVRVRGEWRAPNDFRTPGTQGRPAADRVGDDDDLLLLRTRLWVDATPAENVRAFVQIQDSRTWGEESTVATDTKNVDLHQGFFELQNLFGSKFTLRAGRQELSFGDQRLVSPLDWSNVGRSWDALRLTYKEEAWSADLFTSLVREGSTTDEDYNFNGLYFSATGLLKDHVIDLYVFERAYHDEQFTAENGTAGDLQDVTPGIRLQGRWDAVDYSGEFSGQLGQRAGDEVAAWATAMTLGYNFAGAWKPRVGIEYDYATGDAHPTDGEYGTFDPLFPFGHAYQGLMDIFSWRNGHDGVLSLSAQPLEWAKLYVDWHNFWLDHKRDGWYGAAGTLIRRAPTGSPDPYVGSEIDLHTKITVGSNVDIWAGWGHFFAGGYVGDTGYEDDMDWLFLQCSVKF